MEPATIERSDPPHVWEKAARRVLLADPRGFCAGVERALAIVDRALRRFGSPVYVRREIVHNRHVVDGLRTRGVVSVGDVDEVPCGAVVVLSAHGVAPSVRSAAAARNLAVDETAEIVGVLRERFPLLVGPRSRGIGGPRRTTTVVRVVRSIE